MAKIAAPTLAGLIGFGFLVVVLPLVVAIITAIVQVDALARSNREALVSVQNNTSLSRALANRVRELERTARQYEALGDVTYRNLYDQHRDEVRAMLSRLTELNASAELQLLLEQAQRSERRANDIVEAIGQGRNTENLEAAFSALGDDVLAIVQSLNRWTGELSNAMPEEAATLQSLLIGQAALVIPLSVGLALLFGILISRSVNQLDRGIRTLGRGVLKEPIQVKGSRDLQELGQRLEWLRERLLELEAQKAEFLRNVSHELKTPLTNIRESTELLLDGVDGSANGVDGSANSEENRAIAGILRSNSVRLQQLIEELLRYGADSSIRASQTHEIVALDCLVEATLDKIRAANATRRLRLRSAISPVAVKGNAKHLEAIVDNLLSNAIRHSPCGGEICVSLNTNGNEVTLDVRDQGPGIAQADAPHLFEWFYVGPQPPNALVPGTGIGLAIAQEYAVQHGGSIQVVPSDHGAHFRLTLGKWSDA